MASKMAAKKHVLPLFSPGSTSSITSKTIGITYKQWFLYTKMFEQCVAYKIACCSWDICGPTLHFKMASKMAAKSEEINVEQYVTYFDTHWIKFEWNVSQTINHVFSLINNSYLHLE